MARKINVKLIMELRDAGLSRSTIASTRHISRHSVSEVFNIADEKGIRYDDVRSFEESEVYRLFYPEKFANETMYGDPDYEHVHQELKHVGVTLKLLHEEYVERCERNGEIPMGKTKFNEGYAEFTIANRLTNHLEHKPGERAEVDWSGPTMHYVDMNTGARRLLFEKLNGTANVSPGGKYIVTRNGSSVIAFTLPEGEFSVVPDCVKVSTVSMPTAP